MTIRYCGFMLLLGILGAGCTHGKEAKPAAPVVVAQAPPVVPATTVPIDPAAQPSLSVVETDGTQNAESGHGRFDFGELSLLNPPKLTHIFTLRNDSSAAIQIGAIKTSCGCTSAFVDGDADQKYPVTVAPGQTIHIRTKLDPGHLNDGPFSKSVMIAFVGQPGPTEFLDLAGSVRPELLLDPADVDFGKVHTGDGASMTITLMLDPKLFAGGWKPKVACSVEGVSVTEVKGAGTPSDPSYTARQYKLTVGRQMKIGSFWGQLTVAANPAMVHGNPLLAAHNGFIHGTVFGDFAPEPDYVSFGAPVIGTEVKQTVKITGATAAAVRGLQLHSTSPWVTAVVGEPDPKTPQVVLIHLTLSSSAPKGGFHSEVTVRARNGAVLVLPVQALVRAANE